MINMNNLKIKTVNGITSFEENGITYIKLYDAALLLGLYHYRPDRKNCPLFIRWDHVHKWFYRVLKDNNIKYWSLGLPYQNELTSISGNRIGKYESDLPMYIPDFILFQMAIYLNNPTAMDIIKSFSSQFIKTITNQGIILR